MGAWLSSAFHWRLNFVIITILVFLSLVGTWLFIDESLPKEKRTKLNLVGVLKGYGKLLTSFDFMGYTVISLLPFTGIVIYVSNLSLIFINYLEISTREFGFYQAPPMVSFLLFSALSAKVIAKKGVDYTRNLGGGDYFNGRYEFIFDGSLCSYFSSLDLFINGCFCCRWRFNRWYFRDESIRAVS